MINVLGILTRALLAVATPAAGQVATLDTPTAVTTTSAVSASDSLDKVQKFYASIKQVKASFRQEVINGTFGTSTTNDGTVWILKPGKMRWDYLERKHKDDKDAFVKKSFISNGTNLWVVEHDNKQVFKKSLGQDLMPVAVSFLYGKGDLKTEFNPELDTTNKYGDGKTDVVLKLTPKQPSAQYKTLYLVINGTDFHVSQSIIIDQSNNVNHFRFYTPDFETSIKDSWFEFDPKSVKDYRIIDADQQQNAGSGSGGAPGSTGTGSAAKTAPTTTPTKR